MVYLIKKRVFNENKKLDKILPKTKKLRYLLSLIKKIYEITLILKTDFGNRLEKVM